MLFPVLLVILFFATLNKNPRVLYGPGDFKDERNFLATFGTASLDAPLEVRRDNVREVVETLKEERRQLATAPVSKRTIALANAFYSEFVNKQSQALFSDGILESHHFAMHSPEFFILHFSLPKAGLPASTVTEFDLIIRVQDSLSGPTYLIIGRNVASNQPGDFATLVAELIRSIAKIQRTGPGLPTGSER